MKKRLIPIVILIVAIIIVAIVGVVRHSSKKDTVTTAPEAETVKDEDVNLVIEDAEEENEDVQKEVFDFDVATATNAALEDVDQETFDKLVENLNKNWDVGVQTKDKFINEHPEIFGDYARDKDGKVMIPWSDAQMISQDHARQHAAKELGLEKYPINDALDFPNAELTEKDIQTILKVSSGKISLENDPEDYRTAIFKDWLSKPVVFDAAIELMLDQKIGSEYTLRDNWNGPTRFVEIYDLACGKDVEIAGMTEKEAAEIRGTGANHWLRCFEDKEGKRYYFLTEEYVYDYVIPFISWAIEQPFDCEMLSTSEHYHLVAGDNDILRRAELANYADTKAAFVFRFMLKDNKVGLVFGINARDGRPEVLNYTVTSKVEQKKTSSTTTQVITQVITEQQQQSNPPQQQSTPQGGGSNPPSNPETKSPSDDIANAITDHQDDDPGPGPQTNDIGNSQSPTVAGSQAHADTVVNTDGGNSDLYDPGPAADATDHGTPPDTSAPENQIGVGQGVQNDNYVDNSGQSTAPTSSSGETKRLNADPAAY